MEVAQEEELSVTFAEVQESNFRLGEENRRLREEMGVVKKRLKQAVISIAHLKEKVGASDEEFDTPKEKMGESDTLKEKVGAIEEETETLKENVGETETLKEKVGVIEEQTENMKENVGAIEEETKTLKEKVGETETLKEKVGTVETLKEKVGEIEEETKNLKQNVGAIEVEIRALTEKVVEIKQEEKRVAQIIQDLKVGALTVQFNSFLDRKAKFDHEGDENLRTFFMGFIVSSLIAVSGPLIQHLAHLSKPHGWIMTLTVTMSVMIFLPLSIYLLLCIYDFISLAKNLRTEKRVLESDFRAVKAGPLDDEHAAKMAQDKADCLKEMPVRVMPLLCVAGAILVLTVSCFIGQLIFVGKFFKLF